MMRRIISDKNSGLVYGELMVLSKYDSDRYFAIISDTNQLVIGTIQDIIRSDKNKIIYLTDISDNTGKSF